MKISRSIPGGERTFATFWSLRRIFQKRRLSAWNRTTVRRKIFCKPLQQSWRTMSGGKERIFGRHAKVGRGSDTTKQKSTRLNSSHITTSYAVYCLKKKKALDQECKQPFSCAYILKSIP